MTRLHDCSSKSRRQQQQQQQAVWHATGLRCCKRTRPQQVEREMLQHNQRPLPMQQQQQQKQQQQQQQQMHQQQR
jgi:hypothetical protein